MDDLASSLDTPAALGETGEPRTPNRLYALKDRDTFLVADAFGDVVGMGDGLFHNDTRILSRFQLLLGSHPPSLLSAAIAQDNVFFTSHTANQRLPFPGGPVAPPGVLHIARKRFLWDDRLFERVAMVNYSRDEVIIPLVIEFDADFADMFEVRGLTRKQRGYKHPAQTDGRSVALRYTGVDGLDRHSVITFSDPPFRLSEHRAEFMYPMGPESRLELYIEIGMCPGPTPTRERFRSHAARARFSMRARRRHGARLRSSGRLFDEWMEKSRADLALLTTEMETGPYPYAGIPWFSTTFGRDAIITAWQVLWIDPSLAKGVLSFLADHQASEVSAFRDSAPGKIMHEARKGEMAALGEVPFGRYYGGVDTTPLFVALAGAYAERTGDMELIEMLWPHLEAAVGWIEAYGDTDGDGLIDYARGAESGLANQGWKDSHDSVFHSDGRFATGPIALVEVQGYAFAAYRAMAAMACRRGEEEQGAAWNAKAELIRQAVESRFWMEDDGFYAIAIDGDGELCRVLASNPGHLLFAKLVAPQRGRKVAARLLSREFASGWGVRTLALGEARFNPMSYHNGSVWPHDTALSVLGMSHYGERDGVVALTAALFETAASYEMRLPELLCGFPRQPGEPPVAYPVACLPQAWAAGSVFMMLQACLGITVDGEAGTVTIVDPRLPIGIDRLRVDRLRVGADLIHLAFERHGERITVTTGARPGVVRLKGPAR
ncbi:MAG TPA: amylo-alpha-1,6-glucosidase [Phenylobacterium sp.]|jgi:glycogen debranching enzyme|nr:amylo-alpha-1,6-glucosidase [Phenylobacterium sp.]